MHKAGGPAAQGDGDEGRACGAGDGARGSERMKGASGVPSGIP